MAGKATNTAVATTNTAVQTAEKKKTGISTYLGGEAVKKNIANVVGEKNVVRFISSVVSAVQANPKLGECTNTSILTAALQGEALQLAPSPQLGQFYMVPYDKREKINGEWVTVASEAQFQLGWKGYLQLAIRSGQYRKIVVNEIKTGECKYNPITEEMTLTPIADPAEREKAETVGYYAMFETMNGFKKEIYRPKEAIIEHAKRYSKTYQSDVRNHRSTSVWSTNFDAMAKKTLIRELIGKWGSMSVEMAQAYEKDMAVIDEDGTPRYIDNGVVDVDAKVTEEIAANANSEDFAPGAVEEYPDFKRE